jgi:Zn-dependent oligopeptidase
MFDYSTLIASDIPRMVEEVMSKSDELFDAVASVEGKRTWDNTIAPLAEASSLGARIYGQGLFMADAHPDEDVRNASRAAQETLAAWGIAVQFRKDLYHAIQDFSQTEEAGALEGERARLLEFEVRDLRHAGHELDDESQAALKEMKELAASISIQASANTADYVDFMVVDADGMAGMPESYVSMLEAGEEAGTYKIFMDYPQTIPFFTLATRRDLREALRTKFNNQAVAENRPLLEEIIGLRLKMANLFGLPTWAHYRLEEKMAKTPEAVFEFYAGLLEKLPEMAAADYAAMEELLVADGEEAPLRRWDIAFYDNVQQKNLFGVDQEMVAEHFPLDQVMEGMFELTGSVFGIEFAEVENPPTWHKDARLYAVNDTASGDLIGHFYADLFPREGKFTHAAAFPLLAAHEGPDGEWVHPLTAFLCNFTKPTDDTPSLLKHSEVTTLFHEFGHVLHMTLSKAHFPRFSGASTEWDFVEAPSQIMENWCWEKEVLARFARHHATGEPLHDDVIDGLVAAKKHNSSSFNIQQLSLGWLDMGYHATETMPDLDAVLREAEAKSGLPVHEGTFMPASFGHLMGGYDAGYYGYLWSNVFGSDMWSVFDAEGITSPEVGARYRREILEPNGTSDAIDLLRAFLGREPNSDAFLEMLGIS